MSGLRNGNLQDNEIVKASDVQLIGDGGIENLGKTFKTLFGNTKSVIVGGKLTAYNTGTGLQAKLSPIMGVHKDNTDIFCDNEGKFYLVGDTEIADTISFVNADSSDRRDIVEVKASEITAVKNSRQFYDPETETTSYSQTNTEKRHILVLKVKKGTAGSDTAPETDEGYVKIAEVVIPADATSLEDSNIYNVTADIDGMDNIGWTSEKQITINPGSLQAITDKFRNIHNVDGSLKERVVSAINIVLSGEGALKGSGIQKGGVSLVIDGVTVAETASMDEFIDKIVARLNKTWGIANGGTGGTTAGAAQVNLFPDTGSENLSDNDFLITGYADNTGGFSATKHLYRRPVSKLKTWLKSQLCGNADKLDGYHASTTVNSANTIPVRNESGELKLRWLNLDIGRDSTRSNKAGTAAAVLIDALFVQSNLDGYIRKAQPENIGVGYSNELSAYGGGLGTMYYTSLTLSGSTTKSGGITFTVTGSGGSSGTLYKASSPCLITKAKTMNAGVWAFTDASTSISIPNGSYIVLCKLR